MRKGEKQLRGRAKEEGRGRGRRKRSIFTVKQNQKEDSDRYEEKGERGGQR